MVYRRGQVRGDLPDYIQRELEQIEREFASSDFIQLKSVTAEPNKLRSGLVVYADGVGWDPGSGEGVYVYYNGSWHKLG